MNGTGEGPARLALVDDDARVLRAMLALLGGLGFEIRSFTSPEAALQFVCDEGVDAVITDLLMPGIDGVELCRRVRSIAGDDAPPFLLHTGDLSSLASADRALFASILQKPCSADQILAALLEISRSRQNSVQYSSASSSVIDAAMSSVPLRTARRS
ncbi:response regulator [Sandaracinus amylolyticus]|uniref:response regulator n=1 Tax=Sandaracinus amylolyticus TaxID=927083 RepID=UPI001F004805|nr:response regulator [Sandaracinus amylolyticus]UJR79606.1 Hypothetical protein I5071_16420 [Sandaracinus amylolyticus]